MKSKLLLTAAVSALLALGACGGDDDNSSPSSSQVYNVAALVKTDTVVGTGAEAAVSSTVTAKYTGWVYDTTKTDNKGAQFDTGTLTLPLTSLIKGWQEGVPGMKVGGKRTLVIPASLGYGATGQGTIPANSALVFDIELTAVQATPAPSQVYNAPALVKTDTVIGTGAEALLASTVTAKYTGWLYDTTKTDNKGMQFDTGTLTLPLTTLIKGWQDGVPGMKVGGKRTLVIPASSGYGATGQGPIPANSGLVFDVELTAVK